MDSHRPAILWLFYMVAMYTFVPVNVEAQADDAVPALTLPAVDPGTVVGDESSERWNRVVLLATPRIASGDVNKLSTAIRDSVGKFTLSILATVTKSTDSTLPQRFSLNEVGVGYSLPIRGTLTVVSSKTAATLGASLDFYGRQMLSENEKQLSAIQLVVRTETLTMFDTPAIMLRGREHKNLIMRHLIWVDSNSGKLALLVWLLEAGAERAPAADDTLRFIAPGTQEDRRIHVDGRSFFLGIPSKHAFALEELPPGRELLWTPESRHWASQSTFDKQTIKEFATALNDVLNGG